MNNAIKPLDFYLLRLPLLPLSGLGKLHTCLNYEDVASVLYIVYQDLNVQEAIYLVSPELYQELLKWLARPSDCARSEDKKLVLTLYKYLLRMSSRCTPYGLFAGFSSGAITPAPTQWRLAPVDQRFHKHVRLDMNYTTELSKQVTADSALRTKLTFFVNNSLYKATDAYRYYEYRIRNKRRYYYLVAINASARVEQVLGAAATGASYPQLIALLQCSGIAAVDAHRFIAQLIDSQVLLSELEPMLTGEEFYEHLVEKVATIGPQYPGLEQLIAIKNLLASKWVGTQTYQAVESTVRQLFPAATSKDLIQTDLRINMTANTLCQATAEMLSEDLTALAALVKEALPIDLQSFIKKFYARYEEQEIPLLEALDSETGLGYGLASGAKVHHTPLIDDLRVPGKATVRKVSWTAYRQLIFRKFQESQQLATAVVSITDADLARLVSGPPTKLPATLFALGSLVAVSPTALDRGDFKFHLLSCGGPGAMTLMARFAHADPALAANLAICGQREQEASGEALLAEIVHLPDARVGNVLQRTKLREYEIPFLGNASVPAEQQFPVADLLVSVRQGRVVLRSRRLGKEVIPRLTTAHNYSKGLPVYKFLCDLHYQATPFSINWDWDTLQEQPYLPRVEYKHVILSRARWHLPASNWAEAAAIRTPAQLLAFRQAHRLPERVLLADHDNELLLDFGCPLAVDLLAQQLSKGAVTLFEFVHPAGVGLISGDQQEQYVNEVILPFTTTTARPASPVATTAAPAAVLPQRSFTLGSEWTYLKIYCGAKWADKILTEYVWPCLQRLKAAGHLKQWFFVRYADPDNHLRLRLRHGTAPYHWAAIVDTLHHALDEVQQSRVVSALQYDTYHRELERYGAATMEFSETIFYHDSQAVVRFLDLIGGDEGERYRWLFALRGVDQLLTAFGLTLPDKLALAQRTYQDFFQEFNGGAPLTRQLNDKYREVSRTLTSFLDPAHDTPYLQEAAAVFATRQAAMRAACQALRTNWPDPSPTAPNVDEQLSLLLPSYLHMFLNRIFRANQRLHELVIYHYLVKHYTSVTARTKQLQLVKN
ncbi:lantibiotic dehydratase [Hymenobacter coccineus]|uniref:Lantibiotic dehydratase n=1 Tax=Hymenobacter coccineus TaxID=1908235 RepID=A0A1G1TH05_9BACT|nr:lantibiotic dehydratase [Hymenobacter coccineus]OGX90169.1 hypothetical protein BEN49_07395 [Hymenobacter coccineus]